MLMACALSTAAPCCPRLEPSECDDDGGREASLVSLRTRLSGAQAASAPLGAPRSFGRRSLQSRSACRLGSRPRLPQVCRLAAAVACRMPALRQGTGDILTWLPSDSVSECVVGLSVVSVWGGEPPIPPPPLLPLPRTPSHNHRSYHHPPHHHTITPPHITPSYHHTPTPPHHHTTTLPPITPPQR